MNDTYQQTSWTGIALKAVVMLLAVLTLTACVAQYRNHGYTPNDADLAQIVVGKDTKDTVRNAIGVPQSEGLLADSAWYYVRSQFKHLGAYAPKEVDRQVLAISFDTSGRVSNVERYGLEDGQVVTLSRRVTVSNVQGTTFLKQLFGNLGQVSAEQLLQ
ncbi:outer membrane protein assembly factor BamE [Pacificibacter maritimus]|nr:outer membrane protein assembly factor BamE [Pacificibacter maritimus]